MFGLYNTHGSLIFGRNFHMCGAHQAMTYPFLREARTNMSQKNWRRCMGYELGSLLPEVIVILDALLAQAEQPVRKQVIRVHLNKRDHQWYFLEEEVGLRREVNEQIQWLAAKGWLRLHWRKHEEGNLLEAVDLVTEVAANLYELLGRVPLSTKKDALYRLLLSQKAQEGWFLSFLAGTMTQLDNNKSPAPLSLSDLQESRDLLYALAAIAKLDGPILERTLSVQLFGNSKRLEDLRPAVLAVLRAHSPEASMYGNNDWALLQAHKIYRPAKYIPLTGPFSLQFKGIEQGEIAQLDLEGHLPSISLPDTALRTAEIVACAATALVTVENLTSFNELLFVRPLSVIVVFTGGFACSGLIMFLSKIRAYRPDLPFLHWGNIDTRGLHILAHLRSHLRNLQPLGMDIETIDAYRTHAQPLTTSDQVNLQSLIANPQLADCVPLIDYLMEHSLKLEQEAVSVMRVMDRVEACMRDQVSK